MTYAFFWVYTAFINEAPGLWESAPPTRSHYSLFLIHFVSDFQRDLFSTYKPTLLHNSPKTLNALLSSLFFTSATVPNLYSLSRTQHNANTSFFSALYFSLQRKGQSFYMLRTHCPESYTTSVHRKTFSTQYAVNLTETTLLQYTLSKQIITSQFSNTYTLKHQQSDTF